ncbi:hypothetical protein KWH75_09850 [Morganella morganii]|uniref:hypothetical protein n=1 Tax=Morganella morganii TaxID=582 RepID=UPI0021CF9E17|nr:hypothetical protein [Morganella morganii]MCU6237375.1 hypothetical protein [Morganella morganii]
MIIIVNIISVTGEKKLTAISPIFFTVSAGKQKRIPIIVSEMKLFLTPVIVTDCTMQC